jgi:hypothetical protein
MSKYDSAHSNENQPNKHFKSGSFQGELPLIRRDSSLDNRSIKPPSAVLSEFNKEEPLICSRELFATKRVSILSSNYSRILHQVSSVLTSQIPSSHLPLPDAIQQFLTKQQTTLRSLTERYQRPNTNSRVESKINSLRKKMRVLEIEREKQESQTHTVSELEKELEREKAHSTHLNNKINELQKEKTRCLRDCEFYKLELDIVTEKTKSLEKEVGQIQGLQISLRDARFEVLKKGFHAYLCTFASESIGNQINLSPRRPYENGIYKKRHISCSGDFNQIIWRPISLFSSRKAYVNITEVTGILDGTEDPSRLQPFASHVYITIITPNLNMIIAIDKAFAVYLETIKDLFQRFNHLPAIPNNLSYYELYQIAVEHLQSQHQLLQKLINRYKSTLSVRYI